MQMTSREFNQDLGRAKRESLQEPVVVTDRGTPKHVLMSFKRYQEITAQKSKESAYSFFRRFADTCPDVADIDLEIPPRSPVQRKPVEFD